MKPDMETELVGNEIGYSRPRNSRKDNVTDALIIIGAIAAGAFALWGFIVTHSIPHIF